MLKSPVMRNSYGVVAAMERRVVNSCKKTAGVLEYGEECEKGVVIGGCIKSKRAVAIEDG